jgi:dipeptidyl aminopeptidase/acylaminoacyl peptidase
LTPDWTSGDINIPYFVSNGYLVFVPDMNYHFQHNGHGVVEAVVSGARYLSKLPYVDSTRLALQGHSEGGYYTNYIVTHTHNIFTAACSAAGISDLFSHNLISYYGTDEFGQMGLGVNTSERPDIYMENSPIFNVSEATASLLIEHGDHDSEVVYEQDLEMYHALRRADKKCWFLTYHNADHGLEGSDKKDFTLRLKQFFDYYLRGAPPPVWMTSTFADGHPLSTGVDLDTSGKRP